MEISRRMVSKNVVAGLRIQKVISPGFADWGELIVPPPLARVFAMQRVYLSGRTVSILYVSRTHYPPSMRFGPQKI
jgi:hypothetical protein